MVRLAGGVGGGERRRRCQRGLADGGRPAGRHGRLSCIRGDGGVGDGRGVGGRGWHRRRRRWRRDKNKKKGKAATASGGQRQHGAHSDDGARTPKAICTPRTQRTGTVAAGTARKPAPDASPALIKVLDSRLGGSGGGGGARGGGSSQLPVDTRACRCAARPRWGGPSGRRASPPSWSRPTRAHHRVLCGVCGWAGGAPPVATPSLACVAAGVYSRVVPVVRGGAVLPSTLAAAWYCT